jgi:hypothetical protein
MDKKTIVMFIMSISVTIEKNYFEHILYQIQGTIIIDFPYSKILRSPIYFRYKSFFCNDFSV